MGDVKRLTDSQAARVKRLIRKRCASCDNGNCLLLDDGDSCTCPQLITYSLLCRYFTKDVLPGDRDLFVDIMATEGNRVCVQCGQPFFSKSNRARYCVRCRAIRDREMNRERVRRHRGSM